jgi:hypothetical protein
MALVVDHDAFCFFEFAEIAFEVDQDQIWSAFLKLSFFLNRFPR